MLKNWKGLFKVYLLGMLSGLAITFAYVAIAVSIWYNQDNSNEHMEFQAMRIVSPLRIYNRDSQMQLVTPLPESKNEQAVRLLQEGIFWGAATAIPLGGAVSLLLFCPLMLHLDNP